MIASEISKPQLYPKCQSCHTRDGESNEPRMSIEFLLEAEKMQTPTLPQVYPKYESCVIFEGEPN
jgi:hypothetical protein